MNTYEGMFILAESIDGEAVEPAIKRLHGEIQGQGGTVLSTTRLGKRVFARQMQKKSSGQYVVVNFSIAVEALDAFKARLKLNEDIFRAQFIRVDSSKVADAGKAEVKEPEKAGA